MELLILGLFVFLGVHSIRMVSDSFRNRMIDKIGLMPWKGIYSLLSLLGLALIIIGYGEARLSVGHLWYPPAQLRNFSILFMAISFILIVAAYLPGNGIKATFGHPMVLGVKVWAFAHLISNGSVADITLFGAFLVWAIVLFIRARRRDRKNGITYPAGSAKRNILTVLTGLVSWILFAGLLHRLLIGVGPLGV